MPIESLRDVPAATSELLQQIFAERRPAASDIAPGFAEAVESMGGFVLRGGKRVRPTFAWAGYQAAGPARPLPDQMLTVCAALEFVQACALIHDDIIDRSDTRRGHPTLHREFERLHRDAGWHGSPASYGEGVAILLGDLALAWADDLFFGAGLTPDVIAAVASIWAGMRTEVLAGQYLDITAEAAGDESPVAAHRVMRFKTAAYTVERPLQLGAAIGGADADLIGALRSFGTDVGVAFQLRDDVLGVFGDPEVTGKPAGDDIIAGKRTALLAAALNLSDIDNPAAAQVLRRRIGKNLDPAELAETTQIIHDSGAVARVESQIGELVESALITLFASSAPATAKADLAELATSMTQRRA
ncbi:polyprenyl synthetase family protein [Williamsia sp. 1135]|uniref:polyprenyl synthetase family protein n=1 Tax=Williamsia sp. 1135 TaxID=1889262 RepID=UPI001980C86D|nr:polyprenyl synthetase family protein [Williamsia sp. 1135]